MDADIWWDEFASLTRELTAAPRRGRGRGRSQRHGPLRAARPTRTTHLYAPRSSTAWTPAPSRRSSGSKASWAPTRSPAAAARGSPPRPAGAKMAWIAEQEPEALRPRPPALHAQLLARTQAHRRLRPRPPLGQPEHPALRHPGPRLVHPVDATARPRHRTPELRWSGEAAGTVTAEAARLHRPANRHPGHHRDHRRLGRGAERRRTRDRRPHAHVRHDDVPRPHRAGLLRDPSLWSTVGASPRHPQPRRRNGDVRRRHQLAARPVRQRRLPQLLAWPRSRARVRAAC